MNRILFDDLVHLNKSKKDLVQLLSPEIRKSNISLFNLTSRNQLEFNTELGNKGISLMEEKTSKLDESLFLINSKIKFHITNNPDIPKSRLDLDIAKIVHENLGISKRVASDFLFWRTINLFYFIEITKWRWEKDSENSDNWYSNAKAIFGRTLGLTLRKRDWDEDKSVNYTSRTKRIDIYRYWWIGEKLKDQTRKYYFLEKLSEKIKQEEASVQDFLNHLEGNSLLSPDNRISKILAKTILLSDTRYSEKEARACFNRYNAFTSRQLMNAEEILIQKEICEYDPASKSKLSTPI